MTKPAGPRTHAHVTLAHKSGSVTFSSASPKRLVLNECHALLSPIYSTLALSRGTCVYVCYESLRHHSLLMPAAWCTHVLSSAYWRKSRLARVIVCRVSSAYDGEISLFRSGPYKYTQCTSSSSFLHIEQFAS